MKREMSQDDLDPQPPSTPASTPEPSGPLSLGPELPRLPDRRGPFRRGLSGPPALLALVAIVALAAAALGLPFVLSHPGDRLVPSASAAMFDAPATGVPTTIADDASLPVAGPSDMPTAVPSDMPSALPSDTSTAGPTQGSGGGGAAWWEAITVNVESPAYSGDKADWIEVITPNPTQCTAMVDYLGFTNDLGGFDYPPTSKPRYRTYGLPDGVSGTIYVEVSCWRDWLTGPTHTWRLPVTVPPGPRPAPSSPPAWTLTASVSNGKVGGWVKVEFTASVDAICIDGYYLADGSAGNGAQVVASAGKATSDDMWIPSSDDPNPGKFTLTCTDLDGISKTVTGTFQVFSASATPTPIGVSPTAAPTEPPTAAPTEPPTAPPTEAPTLVPTDAPS